MKKIPVAPSHDMLDADGGGQLLVWPIEPSTLMPVRYSQTFAHCDTKLYAWNI